MEYTTLGRTGRTVSVVGLGCGGPSRLGQRRGHSTRDSERVVRRALDLGITVVDTAEAYGTEDIVGRALHGRRDDVFLTTKALVHTGDRYRTPREVRDALVASLHRLRTDHVDAYFFHGVLPDQYAFVRDELMPAMHAMRDEGLLRHTAVSEAFIPDPAHRMLQEALPGDIFDVVMVGFNILNPSARGRVFETTTRQGVGTLVMFAVRRALSRPDKLAEVLEQLGPRPGLDPEDPLGFLTSGGMPLVEAAYRFCRHEPGADVVLTGTGNVDHLEANVAALLRPPLEPEHLERLRAAFADVDSISGH